MTNIIGGGQPKFIHLPPFANKYYCLVAERSQRLLSEAEAPVSNKCLIKFKKLTMKKIVLFATVILFLVSGVKAQIEMNNVGNVGINITPSSVEKLSVHGKVYFSCTGTSGFSLSEINGRPMIIPEENEYMYVGNWNNKLYCAYAKYIYTSNGAVGEYSDSTIKENITPYFGGLEKIKRLKPVKYDIKESWNDNYRTNEARAKAMKERKNKIGFIAQDLKQVIPEAVWFDENAGLYANR